MVVVFWCFGDGVVCSSGGVLVLWCWRCEQWWCWWVFWCGGVGVVNNGGGVLAF